MATADLLGLQPARPRSELEQIDAALQALRAASGDDAAMTGRFLKWGHLPPASDWTQLLTRMRPYDANMDPAMVTQPQVPSTRDDPLPPLILEPPDKYLDI